MLTQEAEAHLVRLQDDINALTANGRNLARMVVARDARIAELEAKLAATWHPLSDGAKVRCKCGAETCKTVAYWGARSLAIKGADGLLVSIDLGEEYALCRCRVANVASGASPDVT